MKNNLSLLLILISMFGFCASAQESSSEIQTCQQPFSSKFDEFEFTNVDAAKEQLDLFGLQLKNLNAQGVVIGYGGKITESGQGRLIGFKVEEYLTEKFSFYKYVTISVLDGGHREKPTIELFIKPQECSAYPKPSASLEYDEVSYKEETTFFTASIVHKTSEELQNLLVEKFDPKYPLAARAVRARGKVLVLVMVDEKGNVVKTTAIDGHPLLHAATESAIRSWKYKALKENKKSIKYGGKVVIDWDKLWENQFEDD